MIYIERSYVMLTSKVRTIHITTTLPRNMSTTVTASEEFR